MNGERTRILLTLAVALGLGSLVAFLRYGRRRRRARLAEAFEEARARGSAADDDGIAYVTLRSLDEARMMDHTAVIMRGGGARQIYLTVPVKYVDTDEPMLESLLRALDAIEFADPRGASVRFELAPIGSGLDGGRGGASVIDGVWLHPRLSEHGLLPFVSAVLFGQQSVDEVRAQLSPQEPAPPVDGPGSSR